MEETKVDMEEEIQTSISNEVAKPFVEERSDRLHPKFTNEQARKLLDVFTTLVGSGIESPVYCLKNLSPEFISSLFAMYSRSSKPIWYLLLDILAEMCIDEDGNIVGELNDGNIIDDMGHWNDLFNRFIHSTKVKKFHDKYTVKFGHDSIRKMADGIAVAIDSCSDLVANFIAQSRIGIAPMMRSTRYQKDFFAKKYFTRNLFSEDKKIEQSYEALMDASFETAKEVYEYLSTALKEKYPYEQSDKSVSEETYNGWIEVRALDNARFLYPASLTTGVGFVGNALAINNLLTKMFNYESGEFSALAELIYTEVNKLVPNIVKKPSMHPLVYKHQAPDKDIFRMDKHIRTSVDKDEVGRLVPTKEGDLCNLLIDGGMGQEDVITLIASLFVSRQLDLPPEVCYNWLRKVDKIPDDLLNSEDIDSPVKSNLDLALRIIYKYTGFYSDKGKIEGPRMPIVNDAGEVIGFTKLPREFEMVDFTFDLVMSHGAVRDIMRHQMASYSTGAALTPLLGWARPADFDLLPDSLKEMHSVLYEMSLELWKVVATDKRYGYCIAQYCLLMFTYQRLILKANLRELDLILNLRSRFTGNFEYRRISQLIFYRLVQRLPILSKFLRCNLQDYVFGKVVRPKEMKDVN